jgi:hypothetical protein
LHQFLQARLPVVFRQLIQVQSFNIRYQYQRTTLVHNEYTCLAQTRKCCIKKIKELPDVCHNISLCVRSRYLRFRYISDSVNNTLNRTVNPRSAPIAIQYHSLLGKIPEFSRTATPNLLPSGAYWFTKRKSGTIILMRTQQGYLNFFVCTRLFNTAMLGLVTNLSECVSIY